MWWSIDAALRETVSLRHLPGSITLCQFSFLCCRSQTLRRDSRPGRRREFCPNAGTPLIDVCSASAHVYVCQTHAQVRERVVFPFQTDLTAVLRGAVAKIPYRTGSLACALQLWAERTQMRPVSAPGSRRFSRQLTRPRSECGVPRHTFSATLCGVIPPLSMSPLPRPFTF